MSFWERDIPLRQIIFGMSVVACFFVAVTTLVRWRPYVTMLVQQDPMTLLQHPIMVGRLLIVGPQLVFADEQEKLIAGRYAVVASLMCYGDELPQAAKNECVANAEALGTVPKYFRETKPELDEIWAAMVLHNECVRLCKHAVENLRRGVD